MTLIFIKLRQRGEEHERVRELLELGCMLMQSLTPPIQFLVMI